MIVKQQINFNNMRNIFNKKFVNEFQFDKFRKFDCE